jgi:hypothetical protein
MFAKPVVLSPDSVLGGGSGIDSVTRYAAMLRHCADSTGIASPGLLAV